ncbi:o-succinylbenzoate--CoA ligase [Caviibacterium pharyngocola]|uniref:O-succinylbenzoate--CoA ligase n=1 Tax=Caviibacterium pharyngocola TaxID=28159 RepID=A0A2M8RTL8_9PAST|nr:o-succinylbenzoate--CoA ligase [Caviibacterium pharyngocola]PJG82237.1 o-succinylbenzoate--CoA ligase [Caviibacterium pharyngocola]
MFLWRQYAASPLFQDKIALRTEQGEFFTWRQLAEKTEDYAAALQQQGVAQGEGIALCGKNSTDILLLYLAGIQCGARVLGVNPAFPTEKIARLCAENHIRFYFSSELKTLPNVTALSLPSADSNVVFIPIEDDWQRPATMTLTSGSSGLPKAVVHNVQAHSDNAQGVCRLMQFSAQDAWLLSLPLYHVSGQGIVWRWLSVGAELHLPTTDFYASLLQATHASLVPVQLQRLLDYLHQCAPNTFRTRHILLGGMHIPVALTQALAQFGIQSYCGYGMTEMASTVFAKQSNGSAGVGQPLPQREFKLVNGEIWLRGAGAALGYWKNNRIVPIMNDEQWFATKDRGEWRDDELVVLGRADNMFISGGENIQPEEIERVILACENVEQVFILPKEDEEYGQRPVAMIKFKDNFSESAVKNLTIWLNDKLEKFKQPVQYFPLNSENRQGNIKISRVQLKAELLDLLGK